MWPLLPNNYLDMIHIVSERGTIDPDATFREQIPKRDPIFHKHHLTQDPQWEGQVIPIEPVPTLYDSYVNFKKAYQDWATISHHISTIPLLRPADFGAVARLPPISAQPFGSLSICAPEITGRVAPPSLTGDLDLSWSRTGVSDPSSTARQLSILSGPRPPDDSSRLHGPAVIEVLGINAHDFLNRHTTVGWRLSDLEGDEHIRPAVVYFGTPVPSVSPLQQALLTASSYDSSLLESVLQYDLTRAQLDEVMSTKINNTKAAVFLSQVIASGQSIGQLAEFAQISDACRFRVSLLLAAVLQHCPNSEILPRVAGSPEIFHAVVVYLNITSRHREQLLPLIADQSREFQNVNCLYLYSVFLAIMRDSRAVPFFRNALEPCRQLLTAVVPWVASSLPAFRAASAGSPHFHALVMLLRVQSAWLHRVLLADNFLDWMPPRLLCAIQHLPVVGVAATAFIASLSRPRDLRVWLAQLTEAHCSVILAIFQELRQRADEGRLLVPGPSLLALLEAVLELNSPSVLRLATPLAQLLGSSESLLGWGDPAGLKRLSNCLLVFYKTVWAEWTAYLPKTEKEKIKIEPPPLPNLPRLPITLLLSVAGEEGCARAIVNDKDGFEPVVENLVLPPDASLIHLNWDFLAKIVCAPETLEHVLKTYPKLMATITNNDQIVLKKFIEFSLAVLRRPDRTIGITTAFCSAMKPFLGQLSLLWKNRKKTLRGNENLIRLIEDYTKATAALEGQGVQDYLETFSKHMSGGEPEANARRGRAGVRKALSMMVETPVVPG
jgi:hypothetical protein